jgi:hypothetical protein
LNFFAAGGDRFPVFEQANVVIDTWRIDLRSVDSSILLDTRYVIKTTLPTTA